MRGARASGSVGGTGRPWLGPPTGARPRRLGRRVPRRARRRRAGGAGDRAARRRRPPGGPGRLVGLLAGEADLDVVGEAGGRGRGGRAAAATLRPDVVLMDLRMPVLDGAGATAAILAAGPTRRVLVLTTYDTDADILRAVEAGATGYLLKDTPRDELVAGVRAAARGETVLAPSVARAAGRTRCAAGRPSASRRASSRCCAASPAGWQQRRDRPRAVHRRGDGEDPPAAGVRQARRRRPDPRRDGRRSSGA